MHGLGSHRWAWRLIKLPPRVAYALGLGPLIGPLVLLLTTTGRKTGLPRVTPLQYEEVDGRIVVAAAFGPRADWFRNLLADPEVEVRIGARRFRARAETVTDPARVADFLALRLERHPHMMGAITRADGLPASPARADLERYARQIALAVLTPLE